MAWKGFDEATVEIRSTRMMQLPTEINALTPGSTFALRAILFHGGDVTNATQVTP